LLLALVLAAAALAQSFPALTGRVVDAANILRPEDRAALDAKLKAHEDRTSDQVVVATVPSLDGIEIEEYANRLYRHWQLGQRDKNNGVLLLVAPRERRVRIEVGYGLEGALTDALSKVIIATAIAPRFQQNDFGGGLNGGVDAILNILTGDAEQWQRRVRVREDEQAVNATVDPVIAFILLLILIWVISRFMSAWQGPRHPHRRRRGGWIVIPGGGWGGDWSGGGGWSRGGGWSGGGGGGFSGGGGSSGGGGASGSW
jgi:uncharacterized protein